MKNSTNGRYLSMMNIDNESPDKEDRERVM